MINPQADQLRRDEAALREALEAAGATFKGKQVFCPFHENKSTPAGSVYEDAGVWKYKCHGCEFGGDVYDVRARAEGKTLADVLPRENRPSAPPPEKPRRFAAIEDAAAVLQGVEARFTYSNPDTGAAELVVFRLRDGEGKKSFRQASPFEGGFAFIAPPKPWPIYGRPRIRGASSVVVVEGEKCVHALADLGFVATTSPAGAGKADYADWSPLAGKTVYLWADFDKPGAAHMQRVAGLLERLNPAPEIRVVDVEALGLPEKGDAADFIAELDHLEREGKIRAVEEILSSAKGSGAAADVEAVIEATISGRRRAIDWPWPKLSSLVKALLPGTVTIVCGSPGGTKTLAILQALGHWRGMGVPVALFALEEDRAHNVLRALAQASGNARMTDDEWVRANPGEARRTQAAYHAVLNDLGRAIWDAPESPVSLPKLAEWVEARAKEGARIIAIDPITAAQQDREPWVADGAFMQAVKATARRYACSVVLVTHPRKGSKGAASLDDLAGGAAYQRFSQSVLWLEFLVEPKEMRVTGTMGPETVEANRILRIEKARNGRGGGLALAFNFDGATLRLSELGVISKEKKGAKKPAA